MKLLRAADGDDWEVGCLVVTGARPRTGKHNADNNDDILIHILSCALIFKIDMLQNTYFQHGKLTDGQHQDLYAIGPPLPDNSDIIGRPTARSREKGLIDICGYISRYLIVQFKAVGPGPEHKTLQDSVQVCSVTQDSGYYNAGCYVTSIQGLSIQCSVWCHGVAEGQHWPGHSNHLLPLCLVTIITINLRY